MFFHLGTWARRRLEPEAEEETRSLRGALGLTDLLILHGSAFEQRALSTLVCGPSAIGKTTTLRRLEAGGRGRLVEDGILLLGRSAVDGTWSLVSTGTLPLLLHAARLGHVLRRLVLLGSRQSTPQQPGEGERQHGLRSTALAVTPRLAFALATATHWHRSGRAEIGLTGVRSLVFLSCPGARHECLLLPEGGGLTVVDPARLRSLGLPVIGIEIGASARPTRRSPRRALAPLPRASALLRAGPRPRSTRTRNRP